MRRYGLLFVLALSIFLLYACASTSTNHIDKEAPAVLASAGSQSPSPDVTAQGPSSPDAQHPDDETGVSSPEPDQAEIEETPAVSPQIPSDESGNSVQESINADAGKAEAAASPEVSPTPDNTIEQEPEVEISSEQPPLMTQLVQGAGLSFEDIAFTQLVLVAAEGSKAMIYCYDKGESGQWVLNEDIGYVKGYVGRNGVSIEKLEGDGCTPGGLFALGYAFGNNAKPATGMAYKAITEESYWVDDPNSIYYNQWVEGKDDADWSSAEYLSENVVSYAYAVNIEYNTAPNIVAGKGSAIFLHIGNKPTSGCITVTEDQLLHILKWLSSDKSPGMLIAAHAGT